MLRPAHRIFFLRFLQTSIALMDGRIDFDSFVTDESRRLEANLANSRAVAKRRAGRTEPSPKNNHVGAKRDGTASDDDGIFHDSTVASV